MSTPEPPTGAGLPYVPVSPLLPSDPPKVDEFWLDARLHANRAGTVFTGHTGTAEPTGSNTPVMLILLSEGAASDPVARDRMAGVVNELDIDTVVARGGHGQDTGRLGRKFRSTAGDPVAPDDRVDAPWAALLYDGSPEAADEAQRILNEVELSGLPQQGRPAGPDYQHYWIDRVRPGLARLWPLPWPGRFDRAGWRTILVSWLLMLLIAAIAVFIAILIFRHQPPQEPPPPIPNQSASPPPQSGSPPPQSGSPPPPSGSPSASGSPPPSASPSPRSASASPQSGSPSPSGSQSGSASASASPSPSGSQSGNGQPTPSPSGTALGTPTPPSKL